MEATKFIVGRKYYMRSACNYDCMWKYTVVDRTAKTVTLEDDNGKMIKCRLSEYDGAERCKPLGSYSMAPVLRADKLC